MKMIDNMIRTDLLDEIFRIRDQEEGDETLFSEILGPSKGVSEPSETKQSGMIGQRELLKIVEEE